MLYADAKEKIGSGKPTFSTLYDVWMMMVLFGIPSASPIIIRRKRIDKTENQLIFGRVRDIQLVISGYLFHDGYAEKKKPETCRLYLNGSFGVQVLAFLLVIWYC